ncbi:TolC family protein [Persicobacter psychrovividus]|uniref:Transporter n=1 Tax=Persicobacter psychrovividus TaxID=387638 RepID=A0ABM7VED1_9BACT|nr:transporter [Persicobacter psychrovividus]
MNWKHLPIFFLLSLPCMTVQAQQPADGGWDLLACIEYAKSNSLVVSQQKLNKQESEINLKQARASRFPTISGGGRYGNSWGRSIDRTTNLFVNQRIQTNGVFANANMPIFAGMQVNNNINQANTETNIAEKDLEKSLNDVMLQVTQSYMNVIFNKELLANAKDKVATTEKQVDQLEKQYNAGAVAKTELLQMQSTLASNEAEQIQQENNLRFALLQLQQNMQKPVSTDFDIVVPDINPDKYPWINQTVEQVYAMALQTQPEIQAAEERETSALYAMRMAKGALLPSLSLSASTFTNYSDQNLVPIGDEVEVIARSSSIFLDQAGNQPVYQKFSIPSGEFQTVGWTKQYSDNWSNELLLNLSIPIFEGFKRTGDYQRAKIQQNRAALNAVQTKNELRQSIEQAYNDAYSAVKTYDAAQKSVIALEENLRAVQSRFDAGSANSVEFQIASNSLFAANTELVRAKYDYVFKLKLLEFYTGQPITL